jgi:hypothetical protein
LTRSPDAFTRRFRLHVLPKGLHRIRHYRLLASAGRKVNGGRARELLVAPAPTEVKETKKPHHHWINIPLLWRSHGRHRDLPACRRSAARAATGASPYRDVGVVTPRNEFHATVEAAVLWLSVGRTPASTTSFSIVQMTASSACPASSHRVSCAFEDRRLHSAPLASDTWQSLRELRERVGILKSP